MMKFIKKAAESRGVFETVNENTVDVKTGMFSIYGSADVSGDVTVSGKVFLPGGYTETAMISGTNATIKRFDALTNTTAKCVISGNGVTGRQATELLLVIKNGIATSVKYGTISSNGDLFELSLVENGNFVDLVAVGHELDYVAHIQVLEN